MTAEQVAALGPAFTEYLREFRPCFVTGNTFAHLGTYCRGLAGDLARKSVEPIALAGGTAVRTLQEFLTHHVWDHDAMLARLQRRVVAGHLPAPGQRDADELGVVGLIDETSVPKKGDKTLNGDFTGPPPGEAGVNAVPRLRHRRHLPAGHVHDQPFVQRQSARARSPFQRVPQGGQNERRQHGGCQVTFECLCRSRASLQHENFASAVRSRDLTTGPCQPVGHKMLTRNFGRIAQVSAGTTR